MGPGPAGAVQMAVLRVSVAHTLSGVAAILLSCLVRLERCFPVHWAGSSSPPPRRCPDGLNNSLGSPGAPSAPPRHGRHWPSHKSVPTSRPVTGPFGTHWRTISSNSRRKLLPKEGFLHRSWETGLWSGTRSRRSSQVRPNWGLCQRLHRGQKCQRVFLRCKTSSIYTLALLDTNVHPTNLRKCKKSNYLPILDVFKDFATIVVDDSPNHNRNLRKILIFSHVRLNNYNIPFYYNMWRTMQRRSEVSCRTKY